MKNLEKLKIALIEQIEKMSASEFEELTDVLQDQASGESFLDTSVLFSCDDCRKFFGDCNETHDTRVCSERFEQYALTECKQ